MTAPRHIAILGGGLAGLSLALQLRRHGVGARLTVVEPRAAYADDRTWGFWDTDRHPFEDLVARRWPCWRVRTAAGEAAAGGGRYRYCRLPAPAVYARALDVLSRDPEVDLRMGAAARGIACESGGYRVQTDAGDLRADLVFDGRPPPPNAGAAERYPFLWQQFEGWRVRVDGAAFRPDAVDLMDFRGPQDLGLHFLYVLPEAPDEALVEATWLVPDALSAEAVTARLAAAVERLAGGRSYAVPGRERGRIPMTTAPPPPPAAPGVVPIGTRAGAPRPSTGYAFLPIQRHGARIAAAVARGRPPLVPMRGAGTVWLDTVFLRRLLADPAGAPELFLRLFRRVPADRLVRFLSETGTPADVLAAVLALPAGPMLRAALPRIGQAHGRAALPGGRGTA